MRKLNRRNFIVRSGAGVTAMTTGLAGCAGGGDGGEGGNGGGGSTTTSGSGNTPMPEQYTSKMAAAHYPVLLASTSTIVAEEQGFFDEYNITNDEVTSFSGGGSTVRGVVTGGLTAGKGALMAVAKAYRAGAPAHLVGMMLSGSTIGFYSLPDSDIESIQDLKGGGKVGLSNPGGSSEAVALKSVDNADGITLDDVEFVHTGGLGEAITSLNEENVDVIFLPAPVSQQMKQEGNVREIWHARDLAPNVTEHVMFMGQRTIEEQRPLAEGIVRAHSDAMDYIQKNPEESARMWANASDQPEDLAIAAMQEETPQELWNPELTGDLIKGTGEAMILQGLIDEQPAWEDIIRQDLLPEDKRVDWV